MIFKAKWNWKNKKEIIAQLEHCCILIEQGFKEGYGWTLGGDEDLTPEKEVLEEKLPEQE